MVTKVIVCLCEGGYVCDGQDRCVSVYVCACVCECMCLRKG